MHLHELWNLKDVALFGLPADLVAHVLCGAFIYVASRAFGLPVFAAFFVVFAFAMGKECLDCYLLTDGSDDWESIYDIASSLAGGVGGALLSMSLNPSSQNTQGYARR
ncbi:MAG TPA: hypothetical protein VIH99_00885 [Bdellovibrionota bacterium]|jgi:hypothetical protein